MEGTGSVVMVLRGGHCSRSTRLPHEILAGRGFTVHTPSRPGDDATPLKVGRTAQAAADALAALLDKLPIPAADSHLIWIGQTANAVWEKRLPFLKTPRARR